MIVIVVLFIAVTCANNCMDELPKSYASNKAVQIDESVRQVKFSVFVYYK